MTQNGSGKFATQHAALGLLSRNPEGLTFKQLGAELWPGKSHTHLPAGRIVSNLIVAGLAIRNEFGVVRITEAGADSLTTR